MASFPTVANPTFKWSLESGPLSGVMQFHEATLFGPAINYSQITPDATGLIPLPQGPTRGIIADIAGTLTGHDAYGNLVNTIPIQPGYNPICLAGVTSIATTTEIWGVW